MHFFINFVARRELGLLSTTGARNLIYLDCFSMVQPSWYGIKFPRKSSGTKVKKSHRPQGFEKFIGKLLPAYFRRGAESRGVIQRSHHINDE